MIRISSLISQRKVDGSVHSFEIFFLEKMHGPLQTFSSRNVEWSVERGMDFLYDSGRRRRLSYLLVSQRCSRIVQRNVNGRRINL